MSKRPTSSRFEQRDIAARHDFRGANYEPPQTVTAQERLQLMRERAKPAPQQHLKPKGVDHARIDYTAMRLKERRINHIDTRLKVASLGMNRDHLKALNKGRAKAGFNQSARTPLPKKQSRTINREHER